MGKKRLSIAMWSSMWREVDMKEVACGTFSCDVRLQFIFACCAHEFSRIAFAFKTSSGTSACWAVSDSIPQL